MDENPQETQLATFKRKMDRRQSIFILTSGISFFAVTIWGFTFIQDNTLSQSFLTFNLTLGISICVLAVITPFIDNWRRSRPHYVPPSPSGWGQFALSLIEGFIWTLLWIWDFFPYYLEEPSYPYKIIGSFSYLALLFMLLTSAFFILLPQAVRSVHVSFQIFHRTRDRLKKDTIPMNCWRDETFGVIVARLQHNASFKRRLTKLQIPPTPELKLIYQNQTLVPESTPAKRGFKLITHITVSFE